MVHPDAVGKVEDRAAIERIEPIYPLTQGITNKLMNKSVAAAERMIPPCRNGWTRRIRRSRNGRGGRRL